MYVDNNLLLSGAVSALGAVSGQTVTGNGISVLSTNTIDLSSNPNVLQTRDIGTGDLGPYGRFEILTAGTGGTSMEFQIITADDAALTTNIVVLATTGAILTAALIAGARFAVDLPPRIGSKGQRYIGARYVIVGNMTTGAYMADIGIEIQDGQKFYPNGFSLL